MVSLNGVNSNSISTLFSGLSSSKGTTSSNSTGSMLSDYYSIRNGSYKKLLNAYYGKYGTEKSTTSKATSKTSYSSNSTSADSSKILTKAKTDANNLTQSTQALLKKGTTSLFNKVSKTDKEGNTTTDYDYDKIYNGLKSFVDNYNTVMNSAEDINSSSIQRSISGMSSMTKTNENMLSKIGITINSDNTLSIDKDTVKSADIENIKSLFNKTASYGYSISAKASEMNFNAGIESRKTNTYTNDGTYSSNYSSGSLYNSFF